MTPSLPERVEPLEDEQHRVLALGVEALLELLELLPRAASSPCACSLPPSPSLSPPSRFASFGFVPGSIRMLVDHRAILRVTLSYTRRHGRSRLVRPRQGHRSRDGQAGHRRPRHRLERPDDARRHRRHDRLRQDRARDRPARGGAPRGHSGADHRPEGRHGQPRAHVPRPCAGELPALGERLRRPGRGDHGRAARREDGDDLARGAGGAGHRARADPEAEGRGRRHDLHARLVRGRAAERARLAARAGALVGHRGGDAARRDRGHGDEPARARRDHRRSAVEPRARAALEPDRERLAGRARPRPRRP